MRQQPSSKLRCPRAPPLADDASVHPSSQTFISARCQRLGHLRLALIERHYLTHGARDRAGTCGRSLGTATGKKNKKTPRRISLCWLFFVPSSAVVVVEWTKKRRTVLTVT